MTSENFLKEREIKKAKMIADFDAETKEFLSIVSYKEQVIPKVNEVLHKLGLKSITENDLNFMNPLCMDFSVEGTSFKFISFKGYDKQGLGKNHQQLVDKSHKIEKAFLDAGIKVSVNYFSIEDCISNRRTSKAVNRVLFTLIK